MRCILVLDRGAFAKPAGVRAVDLDCVLNAGNGRADAAAAEVGDVVAAVCGAHELEEHAAQGCIVILARHTLFFCNTKQSDSVLSGRGNIRASARAVTTASTVNHAAI